MDVITIEIIDTNIDNDLVLFKINNEKSFCISKQNSKTLKQFIYNVFIIAINAIKENEDGNGFDITNINIFDENPISYDNMKGSSYNIEYTKKEINFINYEIEL
jgi:hypothetical protein